MKAMFWGLFVAGLAACAMFGIGPTLKRVAGDWMSPWMLVGIALGIAIVAVAIGFATGVRPAALLATDSSYVIALAVLLATKVAVSLSQVAVSALGRG